MSRTSLELAVVGATGATGEQVLAALDASDMVIGSLHAYGSPSRSPRVDTVSFRGEQVGVEPIGALASARPDLAILCVPAAVAGKIAPGLVARGVVVLDVGNATAGVLEAPLTIAGAPAPKPEEVAKAGAVRTPSSVGAILAAVCAPLAPLGLTGCSAVVNVAASARGRGAMEELGQQVVAALNNQDPQRRVFVDGLAFDTLPEDVATDEWSAAEQLAATEVRALAGVPTVVQIATQPLFAGVTAGVHLRGVTVEDVEEALRGAPGLGVVTRTARLRPRTFTGKPGVAWGRLRADPAGDGVHLWLVTDDLATAGAEAARVAGWLVGAGLLGVA